MALDGRRELGQLPCWRCKVFAAVDYQSDDSGWMSELTDPQQTRRCGYRAWVQRLIHEPT
jgi:hypothetical protein